MSRRIVAALAVVFACGCGAPPAPPAKGTPATSTADAEAKKTKKKTGSNSTTKKDATAPVLPVKEATKVEETKVETKVEETKVEEEKKTSDAKKLEVIPASFNKAVTLSVPDMHCEFACFPKVKKTLESVAGVAGIKADIENHTVSFMVDPAKYQEEKALTALKDAKYPATVKLADSK